MLGFSRKSAAAAMILVLISAAAAQAQTVEASVRLTGHLHPQSEEEARILLDRVEKAASEACGAFKFSIADYGRAVRRSSCWEKSVSDAVARIDSPILSEVYSRKPAGSW
jgi:UrcA family protein